jgi:hypothetical protein
VSPITARATTSAIEEPSAWITRPVTSADIVGAAAHISVPTRNSSRPPSIAGRRPYRSDSGPPTRMPAANAISEELMTVCVAAVETAKSARMIGSAGSTSKVATGPSALQPASSSSRPRSLRGAAASLAAGSLTSSGRRRRRT